MTIGRRPPLATIATRKGFITMSSPMSGQIPTKSDPRWAALVKGGTTRPVTLLALKFMLTRMGQDIKQDPSPGNIGKAVDELHGFFVKNPQMTAATATILFS